MKNKQVKIIFEDKNIPNEILNYRNKQDFLRLFEYILAYGNHHFCGYNDKTIKKIEIIEKELKK